MGNHATPPLPFKISAHNLRNALQALPTVGEVSVTRDNYKKLSTSSGEHGYNNGEMLENGFSWTVTFLTNIANTNHVGDLPGMVVSTNDRALPKRFTSSRTGGTLTGTDTRVQVVTSVEGWKGFEQQIISVDLQDNAAGKLGGTFTLTFEGKTTNPLAYNAHASVMKKELEALGNTGELYVTQSIQNSGYEWHVVFKTLLGNVPSITGDKSMLSSTEPSDTPLLEFVDLVEGTRPAMTSSLKNEIEISGSAISGTNVEYTIHGLLKGANYHVRVSAWNGVGDTFGKTQYCTPAVIAPAGSPLAPV